jgi:hypothetical protein
MTSLSSSKVAPTNLDEMYGATVATTFSLDDKQMKCLLDQGFTRGKLLSGRWLQTMECSDLMFCYITIYFQI